MIDGLLIAGAEPTADGVRVLVGPILVRLVTSARDQQAIIAAGPAQVHCELEIDDGRPALVGFLAEEDRELYRCLRELSGVGPRTALAVTGLAPARDLLRAASAGDAGFLARAQGIGKARAEKIVAHLRARYGGRLPVAVGAPLAAWVEARDGLRSAGLGEDEAERRLAVAAAAGHRRAEPLLRAAMALGGAA